MLSRRRAFVLALVLVLVVGTATAALISLDRRHHHRLEPSDFTYLRGVNVYTLQAAPKSGDGRFHGESSASYAYLRKHGVRLIRLNIPWAALQPVLPNGNLRESVRRPVDKRYLAFLKHEVATMEAQGLFPLLDLHNGCAYPAGPSLDAASSEIFCGSGLRMKDVTNVWLALSSVFKDDPLVAGYDLFNEPRADHIRLSTYEKYTQAVVKTLRSKGDKHTIWVESMAGKGFTLADDVKGGPWIKDPLHKIEYSQHFYPGSTATEPQVYPTLKPPRVFVQSLIAFGQWCRKFAVRCSVGEVGWPRQQAGESHLSSVQWNGLGEQFYEVADMYKMDVAYFGASSDGSNWLTVFGTEVDKKTAPIAATFSQATIIEKHPSLPA